MYHFYPRSPCGERQFQKHLQAPRSLFLSTLSLRRATARRASRQQPAGISIHALLAESDSSKIISSSITAYFYPRSPCGERRWLRCWQLAARDISIHALLAESDPDGPAKLPKRIRFLSTLSLRRATVASVLAVGRAGYFYPRSPCGERQANAVDQILPGHISIHALLAESDFACIGFH